MQSTQISPELQHLYLTGEQLSRDLQEHLDSFPYDNKKQNPIQGQFSPDVAERIDDLKDRAHRWYNELTIRVLPRTTFDRSYINLLLRRIVATIKGFKFFEEFDSPFYSSAGSSLEHNVEYPVSLLVAKDEVRDVMDQSLRLLRTATASAIPDASRETTRAHLANTAFILMWIRLTLNWLMYMKQ